MFSSQIFYNNSIQEWLTAFGSFVIIYIILISSRKIISSKLHVFTQKTTTDIDDLISNLINKTSGYLLLVLSLFAGYKLLNTPAEIDSKANIIVMIVVFYQLGLWGNSLITFFVGRQRKDKIESDAASVTAFSALGFVIKILLWAVIVLLALDNMGFNVTTLAASLGVGGIAVALAVQNILGDLFASMSIVLDKPFVIGDFIIVDEYLGSVEHVGLKTTRIRSLSGEQLIISNSDLLQSRIRNYKRMLERRIVFSIGVTYDTEADKLKIIPDIIKKIIENTGQTRFDRSHFKDFGNFSLNFETVYWVISPDYNIYMDIQQKINLEIYEKFQEQGITFAYPTQTLYLETNTADS